VCGFIVRIVTVAGCGVVGEGASRDRFSFVLTWSPTLLVLRSELVLLRAKCCRYSEQRRPQHGEDELGEGRLETSSAMLLSGGSFTVGSVPQARG
jgi:hypothetical protein